MDDRDAAAGSLAEEVRASALLIGLAVLGTVGIAALVYLLLPAGS